MRTTVRLGKLVLPTPLLPASGVFGFGEPLELPGFSPKGLGGIITKGVTIKAKEGNPPPRLLFGEDYLLNSVGLENPGVEAAIELLTRKRFTLPLIVNVAGSSIQEYIEVVERLSCVEVSAFEINLSCPNVRKGGISLFSPATIKRLETELSRITDKPLWFKVPPLLDPISFGNELENLRGKKPIVLVVSNTLPVGVVSESGFLFKNRWCGYSGPVLHMINLRTIKLLRENYPYVQVVGCGGVMGWKEVYAYRRVGAMAVEIGRGFLLNPNVFEETYNEMEEFLRKRSLSWEEVKEID